MVLESFERKEAAEAPVLVHQGRLLILGQDKNAKGSPYFKKITLLLTRLDPCLIQNLRPNHLLQPHSHTKKMTVHLTRLDSCLIWNHFPLADGPISTNNGSAGISIHFHIHPSYLQDLEVPIQPVNWVAQSVPPEKETVSANKIGISCNSCCTHPMERKQLFFSLSIKTVNTWEME